MDYAQYADAVETNECTKLLAALGKIRQNTKALSYGDFKELVLTNTSYAFARNYNGQTVLVSVNNADNDCAMNLPAGNCAEYVGALSGVHVPVNNGWICVNVKANSGEIWIPADAVDGDVVPVEVEITERSQESVEVPVKEEKKQESEVFVEVQEPIEELQEAILERMRRNGPVTDQMKKDVMENVYHNSLVNWIRSFQ